jgi:2-amino-4-hydroxy-6-hydroxymethyldihydropteridine diphosphokinase
VTAEPQVAPSPRRVLLALGSNLGDRRRTLREAIDPLPGVFAVSRLYETDPVGGPPGQDPYLNLVVAIESAASARQLLGMCHRIESAAGRVRGARWGPRTLDIDILWIDGETVDEPDLSVPHPRMFERRFVLEPLNDVAPDLLPQGWEDVDGRVTPVEPL